MHISFSEIVVILLVALLVIKPERLPGAAMTLGIWLKNIRHMIFNVKNAIDMPQEKYFYREDKKE